MKEEGKSDRQNKQHPNVEALKSRTHSRISEAGGDGVLRRKGSTRAWAGELGRQEKIEMRWCQKEGSSWIQGESSHLRLS